MYVAAHSRHEHAGIVVICTSDLQIRPVRVRFSSFKYIRPVSPQRSGNVPEHASPSVSEQCFALKMTAQIVCKWDCVTCNCS